MNLERDFTTWVDRSDPAALTRVFDATAGRLLLLATHVAGGHSTAEDLVQATFLAAMARSSTWQRGRPVWPWLVAILHNEARQTWRTGRRRREVGIADVAESTSKSPDPAILAASDEAFAAVVSAIDGLALPYRQVLRLRLVHGLQPAEIAHALETPVGTVRAQLHRGLDRLRNALPTSVAIAAAAWLTGEGAVMAQVRARVLAEAGTLHAAAGASASTLLVTGGWWAMNAKAVGLAGVGIAVLLLLGVTLDVFPGPDGAEPGPDDAGLAAARIENVDSHVDVELPGEVRTPVETSSGAQWPLVVHVQTGDGQPIANAKVNVWFAPRGYGIEYGGEHLRKPVGAGVTSGDGNFGCALDELRGHSVLLRRTNYVFVTVTGPAGQFKERVVALPRVTAASEFSVEVKLAPGVGVVGRVLDQGGSGISGAAFYWQSESGQYFGKSYVRSGEDGHFEVEVPDPDSWPARLVAVDPDLGIALAALPPRDEERSAGAIDVGDIVLTGDAVEGRVVLGDGTGLGGFPLFVQRIDPAIADDDKAVRMAFYQGRNEPLVGHDGGVIQNWARPTTAADGSFACRGLEPGGTYAIAVRDTRMRMIATTAKVGGDAVRLEVDRQLLVVGIRGDRGEALPGAKLEAAGFDPELEMAPDRIRPGFPEQHPAVIARFFPVDSEGRRMLLSPFGFLWRLGSTDEIAHAEFVRHDVFAGVYRAERTLVLRPETRFGSLRLVVVDEKGEPWLKYGSMLRCLDRVLERNNRRVVPSADGSHGLHRDLPAGRWHVTVYLGEESLYPLPVHVRGEHVEEVVIEDGRTTELKVTARPAGLAAFRLRSENPPKDGKWPGLSIRTEAGDVEVPFEVYDDNTPGFGVFSGGRYAMFLGRTAFLPGKRAFVISADGYRPARCEVDIEVDGWVTVEVDMIAR